jgi:hypothetical protein
MQFRAHASFSYWILVCSICATECWFVLKIETLCTDALADSALRFALGQGGLNSCTSDDVLFLVCRICLDDFWLLGKSQKGPRWT